MNEPAENKLCDIAYEMRGLAATLLAASRGDLQEPAKVVEYAAVQVDRLAELIAGAISENPERAVD